jgi:hypothetical protein
MKMRWLVRKVLTWENESLVETERVLQEWVEIETRNAYGIVIEGEWVDVPIVTGETNDD